MLGRGVRVALVASVVMAVMIVVGVAVLVTTVIRRASAPSVAASAVLDEPAGTEIAAVALSGDRLAVQLRGGGADRVVLLDLARGRAVGRVALAR